MSITKPFYLILVFIFCFSSLISSQIKSDSKNSSLIKNYLPDLTQPNKETVQETLKTIQIDSIIITGNNIISNDTILSYSSLKTGLNVSANKIKKAEKSILRKGEFSSVSLQYNNTNNQVTITVVENPIILDIIFDGASIYSTQDLLSLIQSKANNPSNMSLIRMDIEAIEEKYKKDGYIEAKIYSIKRPKETSGPLIFKIAEGIIDDIVITGNLKTQDYVILRELDIRPGDVINKTVLERNIRQIYNLNYFNNIIPDLRLTEEPHHYDLIVNLDEKETSGAFTFGGGFQPNRGFNIFSDLYWDNLMGKGQLIMLKGNFGLGAANYNNRNNTYQFKYSDPWAFGKRRSFTFRVWSSAGNFQSFNLLNQQYSFKNSYRRGIDTEFGVPHTYDFRTSHKFKYESIALLDDNVHYYLYTYMFNASYDKRDQQLNPTTGYYSKLSIEQGFKFRPKAIDLTRIDTVFQRFFSLFEKQVLFFQAKAGFIRSPDISNESIFVDEYYYVGGSHTVRGYLDDKPFGYGNKQLLGTVEYRYIFTPTFTAYLFSDVGYATKIKQKDGSFTSRRFTDLSSYKVTKGIGIVFVLNPVGPIKIHYGVTEDHLWRNGRVQFNLGYSF